MKVQRFISVGMIVLVATWVVLGMAHISSAQGTKEDQARTKMEQEQAAFQDILKSKRAILVEEAGIFDGVSLACWEYGQCNLCEILVVFINVANGILTIVAILALVFFIWGAGYLMLSQGNEEMVSKGKGIIRATIVGTIIVFIAWQLMNTVVLVVANQSIFAPQDNPETWSPLAWYSIADRCVSTSTDDSRVNIPLDIPF
jgi:hypothetical protein